MTHPVPGPAAAVTVDIICPMFNGARYANAFLQSLHAQTHSRWRLWVRDDGSTDASVDVVTAFAGGDARVRLLHTGGPPLGAAGAFGWLLKRVPPDAEYVMFADQDDVWLPDKIARTLGAMLAAETVAPGPVLVHSDLIVVDEALNEIHRSFWRFARINPESRTLRHVIVKNVVTGATVMLNRALVELTGRIPAEAVVHDWWVACVAAAFGRIVAIPAPTVLYRQHGANTIGARRPSSALAWRDVPGEIPGALQRSARVRADIAAAAKQARVFLDRYGGRLSTGDSRFLAAYARLPDRAFLRRKIDLVRLQLHAEDGLIHNVGILLRA